jgi:hypothetical protein
MPHVPRPGSDGAQSRVQRLVLGSEEALLFGKKTQKNFEYLAFFLERGGRDTQKFFGSFFQKRTFFFRCLFGRVWPDGAILPVPG